MMKRISRMVTTCLAVLLVLSCFTGCSKPGPYIEEGKTQIYVGYFDGGIGNVWINSIKERFETAFQDYKGEGDKVGVQVVIDPSKNAYLGQSLEGTFQTSRQEVVFTEDTDYYNFVRNGLALDITAWVNEEMTVFDEDASIADKLGAQSQSLKSAYEVDGKYYGLPFYEAYYGIMYDINYFDDNRLYLAENSDNGNDGWIIDLDDVRAPGPDNESGTDDDGLPATYADFYRLLTRIKNVYGGNPIAFNQYHEYHTKFLTCLLADYMGEEAMMAGYAFDGRTVDGLLSPGTNETYSKEIGLDNGNEIFRHEGRLKSLEFLHKIINDKLYYTQKSFTEGFNHLQSQEQFILGNVSGGLIDGYAMLVEGTWWENEAAEAGVYNDAARFDAVKDSFNFGYLPWPKGDESKLGEKNTLFSCNNTALLVNANLNPVKYDLMRKFVQFCHTEESLKEFNILTNVSKPFDYTLSTAEQSTMTNFGRQLYKLRKQSDVVYPMANSAPLRKDPNYFSYKKCWRSMVGDAEYSNPSSLFRSNSNITARQYFDGLGLVFTQTAWDNLVG